MTDSSIIQQARDELAKWRGRSALVDHQPWSTRSDYPPEVRVVGSDGDDVAAPGDYAASNAWFDTDTARLIVGTAGNPDLLDAMDEMLAMWADWSRLGYLYVPDYIERLAAAIVAADERMNA